MIIMGVLLAFFGGGLLYDQKGVQGTSILGTIVMSVELWAVLHVFYIQYTQRQVINLLPKIAVNGVAGKLK